MASWFSSAALSEKLNGFKDKVQSKVNNIDPDLIKKLTLQSDEMVSERQQIEEEERRKEAVRDSLAEILPWETRDAEMEILVDECKEVILGLSSKDDTFTGPFVLTGGLPSEEEDGDEEEEEEEDDEDRKVAKDLAAAEASSEKLSKLQPLPKLLADFDLDTHVGLIQRLLKVDPQLVEMHSRLSSGGQRELVFWKNYFFHCAYTRYEAGLSIDEIWSNEPRSAGPAAVTEKSEELDAVDNEADDEEVVFDSESSATSIDSGIDKTGETAELGPNISVRNDSQSSTAATTTQPSLPVSPPSPQRDAPRSDPITPSDSGFESGGGTDYEFVASAGGGDDDGEMDELDAEIAAAMAD